MSAERREPVVGPAGVAYACPLDRAPVVAVGGEWACSRCRTTFPLANVGRGRLVHDLRCLDRPQTVQLRARVPRMPWSEETFPFLARVERPGPMTREEIRRRFGTKLDPQLLAYLRDEASESTVVLDIGCGSGGNRDAAAWCGIRRLVAIDVDGPAADVLADAHRLPFPDDSFDIVLATAVLEHLYHPFVAVGEVGRVLKQGGVLLATGSFWESWHAASCFHVTPAGIELLAAEADLDVLDLWSSWGFVASVGSHALGLARHKRLLYRGQLLFDALMRRRHGPTGSQLHRLRTSGSFGFLARKADAHGRR